MFMEDQAFSPSSDMAPSLPQPPSSSDSKMSLFLSSSCVSPVELTDGRDQGGGGEGVGEEPNHTTVKKFGPL
jgi:hypothetical protein